MMERKAYPSDVSDAEWAFSRLTYIGCPILDSFGFLRKYSANSCGKAAMSYQAHVEIERSVAKKMSVASSRY
jgi:hypothetical protein